MKSILISIKPRFVADILNGKKTLEIRKTCPKNFEGWVYIYCTKDSRSKYGYMYKGSSLETQKVLARFYLKNCEPIKYHFGYYDMGEWTESYILEKSCLTSKELDNYFKASKEYNPKKASKIYGYAWHIENLEIFDKPKEVGDFETCWKKVKGTNEYHRHALWKAPQSYMFVEGE